MKIVKSKHEAYANVDSWRRQDLRIGLVPTMGALHEGHFSLVRRSREEADITAVSIFVNPTQFGPSEDLAKYPRTLDDDLAGLQSLGVDLVFVPDPEQLYPDGFSTFVLPPKVALAWEGEYRPQHFRGVVTVVLKLFNILPATIAYFGEKDFQQFTVIQHMVDDLDVPIRIQPCPTVRDSDGLALSSRNRYLNTEDRKRALGLSKALKRVEQEVRDGVREVEQLESIMRAVLLESHVDSIDYACVVDRVSLTPLEQVDRPAVALIAAHVSGTRLIDNLRLQP